MNVLYPPEAMSQQYFKAFQAVVKSDSSLQARIRSAPNVEVVVAIAADMGFQLNPDNGLRMLLWELQEADLEGGD